MFEKLAYFSDAGAQKRLGDRRTPEDMGGSVGLLAYGSMLGWGVNDYSRAEQPTGDTDSSGQSEIRDREGPIGANKVGIDDGVLKLTRLLQKL